MKKGDLELLIDSLLPVILTQQEEILSQLGRIRSMEARIMAELDDLNTAVGNLQNAVNTAIAKIDALKNAPAGVDPAAVAAAATTIQQAVDQLNTASA